jgi:hypothetical protein
MTPNKTPQQRCYSSDPKNPEGILICDRCKQVVPATYEGLVSWVEDDDGNVLDFRLTHNKKPCDEDRKFPKSSQLDYVRELGFDYVMDQVASSAWSGPALTRLMLIVWAIRETTAEPAPDSEDED